MIHIFGIFRLNFGACLSVTFVTLSWVGDITTTYNECVYESLLGYSVVCLLLRCIAKSRFIP